MVIDAATGRPLPDSAIQRVLFVANDIHVYQIPPLTSNKGFNASLWTSPTQAAAQQIFTARLRIVETSIDSRISIAILLEDPNSGDLFAAGPYASEAVVQQALDSSRFFAVRVQGEGGMKATLGIGFEDRSPAFDFSIALTEAKKVLGFGLSQQAGESSRRTVQRQDQEANLKDFGLEEGEKIRVQIGSSSTRTAKADASSKSDETAALFSIAPPPAPSSGPSSTSASSQAAKDLGFDDGEFGEFQ